MGNGLIRRLAITWAFNTVALYVAAWILAGVGYGHEWWVLLVAGVVFTLVNLALKPILTILSLPFIIVTLGLFYLLINVLMIYVTHWIVPQFAIRDFGAGVLAAVIVSIVNWCLNLVFGSPRRRSRRRRGRRRRREVLD